MLPICFTHGLALLSQYYKSSTCVCSVIFSLQRCCMGVLCCHFRPKMFSPGDHVRYHSRTLGAHVLATIVGPSPNGPQFCHIWYIRPGGVTPVDHESAQLSRLEAVAVESPNGLVWLCKRALKRLPNQQTCIRTAVHRRRRGGTPPWTPLPPPPRPPSPPPPPLLMCD